MNPREALARCTAGALTKAKDVGRGTKRPDITDEDIALAAGLIRWPIAHQLILAVYTGDGRAEAICRDYLREFSWHMWRVNKVDAQISTTRSDLIADLALMELIEPVRFQAMTDRDKARFICAGENAWRYKYRAHQGQLAGHLYWLEGSAIADMRDYLK